MKNICPKIITSNEPIAINNLPRSSKTGKGGTGTLMKQGEMFCLQAGQPHFVSVSPNSTNTQSKSTKNISQSIKTMATQQELFPKNSPTSISSVVASLAKHLVSLVKEGDLRTLEALFSLKSQGFYPLKDLNYCSWKTSKDFSATIEGEPLELSLQPFLSWGIYANGRYLTARISECPKTGKGCSLSDILEDKVEEKYFLSQKAVKGILNHSQKHKDKGNGFGAKLHNV